MIKGIADLAINRKLLLIAIFPSVLSLIVAGIFILILEIYEFQKNNQDGLSAVANIHGNRYTAALLFYEQ